MSDDVNEKRAQEWYYHKTEKMVAMLGAEHDMVMHALIPYAVGAGLDLYYSPNGISGTGIATKELCEIPDERPSNDVFETFEGFGKGVRNRISYSVPDTFVFAQSVRWPSRSRPARNSAGPPRPGVSDRFSCVTSIWI